MSAMSKQTVIAGAALVFAAAGCASQSKSAAAGPVNRLCPIMYEEGHTVPQEDAATVRHKGKTVGFCCEDCINAWNRLSDAEKDRALSAAMAAK